MISPQDKSYVLLRSNDCAAKPIEKIIPGYDP
jgi:hypothetical protein